jgi:hypothetical protein
MTVAGACPDVEARILLPQNRWHEACSDRRVAYESRHPAAIESRERTIGTNEGSEVDGGRIDIDQ